MYLQMSIYLFILWWDQFLPRLPAPFHRCRWGSHRSPLRGPRRLVCACLENPKDVENIWGKPFGKGCFFHIDVSFQPGVMSMCIYIYIFTYDICMCVLCMSIHMYIIVFIYIHIKKGMKRPTYPKFHGWSASRREFGMVDTCCSTQIT